MPAAEQLGDHACDDAELVGAESISGELVADDFANDGQRGESIGHVIARAVALGVVAGGRALMHFDQHARPPQLAASSSAASPLQTAQCGEVMSADETAVFLGVDRNTVYDAAGRNEIPHRRIGKRLLFSRAQLVSWLGACKAAPVRNG